jgi:hypothetical protein
MPALILASVIIGHKQNCWQIRQLNIGMDNRVKITIRLPKELRDRFWSVAVSPSPFCENDFLIKLIQLAVDCPTLMNFQKSTVGSIKH